MTDEPNADTAPPGSSESFNDFTDRAISTVGNYVMNNSGQNTAIITHSKVIGAWNGWEHAGYPEDGNIHMPTYQEAKDTRPGGHQEVKIPDHLQPDNLPYSLKPDNASFDQRFAGWPSSIPTEVPGESYNKPPIVYGTLKGLTGKPVEWPTDPTAKLSDAEKMNTPYYPDVDPSKIQNVGDLEEAQKAREDAAKRTQQGVVSESKNAPGPINDWINTKAEEIKNMPVEMWNSFKENPNEFLKDLAANMASGGELGITKPIGQVSKIKRSIEAGQSVGEVAQDLKLSKSRVRDIMSQNDIKRPDLEYSKSISDNVIRKLINEGKSNTEIAGELGLNKNQVAGRRFKLRQNTPEPYTP